LFLTPPEKLVFEVKTAGGFDFISWNKGNTFIPDIDQKELVYFHEIFFREPTATSDFGLYETTYSGQFAGEGVNILVVPRGKLK